MIPCDWNPVGRARARGTLPAAFRRLEFIEGTGTQWIDTEVMAKNPLESEIVFSVSEYNRDVSILGARFGDVRFYPLNIFLGAIATGCGANFYSSIFNLTYGVKYTVNTILTSGLQKISVDGSDVFLRTEAGNFSTGISLFLLSNHWVSNPGGAKARIFSVDIRIDGTAVRNLLPVQRIADGKPGMYDTVTKQFFTNAGSGEFLYA